MYIVLNNKINFHFGKRFCDCHYLLVGINNVWVLCTTKISNSIHTSLKFICGVRDMKASRDL